MWPRQRPSCATGRPGPATGSSGSGRSSCTSSAPARPPSPRISGSMRPPAASSARRWPSVSSVRHSWGRLLVRRAGRVRAIVAALVAMAALALLLAAQPQLPARAAGCRRARAHGCLGDQRGNRDPVRSAPAAPVRVPSRRATPPPPGWGCWRRPSSASAWPCRRAGAAPRWSWGPWPSWRWCRPEPCPDASPPPSPPQHGSSGAEPMSRAFWLALVVVAMAVALEFSVTFWAASLIGSRTGADLATSATALSAMTFGMALGRTFLASLPNRFPLPALLPAFFVLAGCGLAVLLTAGSMPRVRAGAVHHGSRSVGPVPVRPEPGHLAGAGSD